MPICADGKEDKRRLMVIDQQTLVGPDWLWQGSVHNTVKLCMILLDCIAAPVTRERDPTITPHRSRGSVTVEFGHFEDDFQAAARRVPTGPQDLSPRAQPDKR